MADAIQKAEQEGRLRAEHLIHLRCEVSADNVLAHFADFEDDPYVRLVSLMDHAPGQRQFQTMDQYVFYYQKKRGLSDEAFARFIEKRLGESARNSRRTAPRSPRSARSVVSPLRATTMRHLPMSTRRLKTACALRSFQRASTPPRHRTRTE
ncbi:hypothetical protein AJ87_02215 [Rhizobium yanglingense]|nr:hypothetical protein AJ87_02215 [Rhizobium yanglingense]